MKEKIKKNKMQNIVDMAVSFSAMGRVFEKGSTKKIKAKVGDCIKEFFNSGNMQEYHKKHEGFCKWFTGSIKTAEKKKKDGSVQKSQCASWGQAAKVIDIVLKVCVYYCNLPSAKVSSKIIPWLNGALDTSILRDLKKRYNSPIISRISTIKDIDDKIKYEKLQRVIHTDIKESFNGEIFSVQYDDIKWRELNR